MAFKINQPDGLTRPSPEVRVWVERLPPPEALEMQVQSIRCDLAPSPDLLHSLETARRSTDEFRARYTGELDDLPRADLVELVAAACRYNVVLVTPNRLPAHVLREYLIEHASVARDKTPDSAPAGQARSSTSARRRAPAQSWNDGLGQLVREIRRAARGRQRDER